MFSPSPLRLILSKILQKYSHSIGNGPNLPEAKFHPSSKFQCWIGDFRLRWCTNFCGGENKDKAQRAKQHEKGEKIISVEQIKGRKSFSWTNFWGLNLSSPFWFCAAFLPPKMNEEDKDKPIYIWWIWMVNWVNWIIIKNWMEWNGIIFITLGRKQWRKIMKNKFAI